MKSSLDVLAERVGVEAEFDDALGQKHETPTEKKQTLLKAMEFRAESEDEAAETLEQLDRATWERALPPCVVLYAGRDLNVTMCLPAEQAEVRWTVTLEDGGERTGEAKLSDLKKVDDREVDGVPRQQSLLPLPTDLPWGYHRLRLEGVEGETTLIVSPGSCWLPDEDSEASRFWGVAAQVYLLRSERNWGIGDYTDLRRFVEIVREQGADVVGVNPLHAMFLDQPEQASPYSPLSRYLLNVLNIDLEAIPEFAAAEAAQALVGAPAFQEKLQRSREERMVAYADVASLKLPVLQAVFAAFERGASEERAAQFRAFLHGCDPLLRVSCVYEAVRQYMTDQGAAYQDCGKWPEAFQHANSAGIAEFTRTHAELVRYHLWLQWIADQQMAQVKHACEGMAVGIYRDLAVGGSPSGAEVWSNPEVMVSTAEVGAPPDEWNAAGQNWALPPFHPLRMKEDGYRSFAALVRTNMRHAGGLRIDHAMSLQRLYWIPRGGKPQDGGYVRYPTDDLIGVLALESHRNRCLVVGEDLGTVAPGFRERMAEAKILSYRVLLLERDKQGFVPGAKYPRLALSTASSHDLPTLRGWWEGVDLELKERIGLTKPENAGKAREERAKDRKTLVAMFREDGLLPADGEPSTEQFIDAAHRFLARTSAVLMVAQLEDIVEEPEQINLPATMPDQYPSWSRRVAVTLEALAGDARLQKLARIVQEERGGVPAKG